jgi:hypothetical protein
METNFKSNIQKGLIFSLMLTSVTSIAQLKVFQNGSTSIGSTTAPPTGFNLTVAGGNTSFSSNVGIGNTATPNALLDVSVSGVGSTRTAESTLTHYYGSNAYPRWGLGRDYIASGQAAIAFGSGSSAVDIYIGRDGSGNLLFQTNSGSTHNNRMSILSGGQVGIGVGTSLTANTQFDVLYSTGSAFSSGPVYCGHFVNSNIINGTTTPYVYGVYGAANGTESWSTPYHYGVAGSATNAVYCVAVSGVAVGNGGNGRAYGGYFNASGAGTSGTNYGIYAIAGTGGTNYAGYFSGDVYVNGNGTYTGTWAVSDRQFKTKIDVISNPLAILKKLKPQSYYFDTTNAAGINFTGEKQYGFIAQDIQQILPELVRNVNKPADIDADGKTLHPATNHLAVNYNAFIALLTAAMQSQQSKVDSLMSVTNKQDSINKTLQSQINQIVNNCCNSKIGSRTTQGSTNNTQSTGNGDLVTGNNGQATNAILYQNNPNPFSQTTVVKCFVPQSSQNASLLVFDLNGSLKKSFTINDKGTVNITINGNQLVSGMYYYTLLIDGQEIDTKKMILTE